MTRQNRCIKLFDRLILGHPRITLILLLAVFAVAAYHIRYFRLDASADSLILENDPDLRYSRVVNGRYGTDEFVLIGFTPEQGLLSVSALDTLRSMTADLRQVDTVRSVVSILDVPLLQNPPVPLRELQGNIKHLLDPETDLSLARNELSSSPVFRELLVSLDLKSTAIQVLFAPEPDYEKNLRRRSELLDKRRDSRLDGAEAAELAEVSKTVQKLQDQLNRKRGRAIAVIRSVMNKYRKDADLVLGGVPMISDDMISFVKNDLKVFGIGMAFFLMFTLGIIFRRRRWIILPMLCCLFATVIMMGILGFTGWQVTVISSNFISLQLIITMSLTVHQIVRFTELLKQNPGADKRFLAREMVRTIFIPCLYTSLTTIAGFTSLVLSNILPVINFGWMMTAGICVSLLVTFTLLPAIVMLLPESEPAPAGQFGLPITSFFARLTEKHGHAIIAVSLLITALTVYGISRLRVENSFIDYFRESTEIYQGMKFIDEKLGGTTPLDILIDFPAVQAPAPADKAGSAEDDEFMAMFEEEFAAADNSDTYWFTSNRLDTVRKIHEYLEARPEIGKVMSLDTLIQLARRLSPETTWDSFGLALLFNSLPDDFKEIVLEPYVSLEHSQARISLRIRDSLPELQRNELLQEIRRDLPRVAGIPPEQIRLSGVMVLYNNMLQSLFRSQFSTAGFTVVALFIMFMILFRSMRIALIAIFPNLLASLIVLGVMGMAGIPLDMMTITIVAICIGIAVDNTIHYLHRFRREIVNDWDYQATMYRCHGSIGNAMYYTSITIIVGFSILALSNFIPSVYFGLLTGLSMAMALCAALALLPRMIIIFKPFGRAPRK